MHVVLPPCFEQQGAVRDGETDLAQPEPQRTRDVSGLKVVDDHLQVYTTSM